MYAVLAEAVRQGFELVICDVKDFQRSQVMSLNRQLSQLVSGHTQFFKQAQAANFWDQCAQQVVVQSEDLQVHQCTDVF